MVYKSLNQLVFIWFDLNEKIARFEVKYKIKKEINFILVHVIISVMVYILL